MGLAALMALGDVRVPMVYLKFDGSQSSVGRGRPRALIIAPVLASKTANAGALVQITNRQVAIDTAGQGSIAERMCAVWLGNNPGGELWLFGLDDTAGTPAAGLLTVGGAATADGVLYLRIGGQRCPVSVDSGMTASNIAAAIEDAMTAMPDLPITGGASAATVELIAKNFGTPGNDILVEWNTEPGEALPAGVTLTLTNPMGDADAGATNPSVAAALTAIGDQAFDYVCHPYGGNDNGAGTFLVDSANLDRFEAEWGHVTGRWNAVRQLFGYVFTAWRGTSSALGTAGNGRNDPHHYILGMEPNAPACPWEYAAALCGVAAREVPDAPHVGLTWIPLLGVDGVALPAPAIEDAFTWEQRNTLLFDGVSTATVKAGRVVLERVISTYQVNGAGVPTDAWLDLSTAAVLAEMSRDIAGVVATRYNRHVVVADGTPVAPGSRAVTPKQIKGLLTTRYKAFQRRGWVENIDAFLANLALEKNELDPTRIDSLYPPDIANPLMVFAMLTQWRTEYPAAD